MASATIPPEAARMTRDESGPAAVAENSRQKTQLYCALCIARCGAVATVEDGRFTRLDPDPSHPTGQALCAKGRAAPELVYSQERLLFPMKRTRPKGDPDPGWKRISWDEALDTVARELRRIAGQHGPEAVAFALSSPSTTSLVDSLPWVRRLMNAFGTPNAATNLESCGWGRSGATRYTFGVPSVGTAKGGGMPDIANAGCLVFWGYNPSGSRLTHATAAVEAAKRGMKLIVVDPRHAGLAVKADVWLRVRPGTDGALALGLAGMMIARGWFDRAFVRDWTNGPLLVRTDTGRLLTGQDLAPDGATTTLFAWDEASGALLPYDAAAGRYAEPGTGVALDGTYIVATAGGPVTCRPAFGLFAELCRHWTPEAVAAKCWVEPADLERAARLLWEARPVAYYAYAGHEQHSNTTQTARAMSVLYALTGSFDAPGGNVLLPAIATPPVTGEDLPNAKGMRKPVGLERRPLGTARMGSVTNNDLYRAILEDEPYPIRGMISFGANILVGRGAVARGREALAKLDFFVSSELFLTPTAAMADIVLPAASAFERDALRLGFEISETAESHIQYRAALVPPRGEVRSDTAIVFDLATRLGLGNHFWGGDVEAAYRYQLGPTGLTLEDLRATPGGISVKLRTQHRKYAQPDAAGTPRGFATPTRKVEIYSETFLLNDYAPLPVYEDPLLDAAARPDLQGQFPLLLTGAKTALFCDSQHRALPSLRRRMPYPEAELHPKAAGARGISAGDWVTIETQAGAIRARARFNSTIDPRVVVGPHGWWQACPDLELPGLDPFSSEGANFNLLVGDDRLDPVSGTPSARAHWCEVRRLG